MTEVADYIVVGGGIGGCVVASRLKQRLPDASVVLIEAGPDASDHPLVADAANAQKIRASELNWNYPSVPQRHLNDRVCYNAAGKALGGGSVINSGGWIRGDAKDYDAWAELVGDSRWGYRGFLPYFRKVERYYKEDADPVEHGFEGPIYTQTAGTTGRPYPLREKAKAAWASVGVQEVVDANSGSPQGLGQSVEAWKDGKRQLANVTYPLDGVKVLTETLVDKVLLEKRGDSEVAVGVQLADGMQLRARTEVVVCAGAYRTPQLLMLSGIGPSDELSKHGIKSVVDAPHVGRNLHDHLMVPQLWRLRHPEEGLAVGSPKFNNPNYAKGLPLDWVVTQGVPQEGLEAACAKDGIIIQSDSKTVAGSGRSKLELYIVYVGASANPPVPLDGSHIMTTVVGLLPTSRGSVTLSSRDPSANPVIDNNYYATEHDRYVMRTGLKQVAQMMVHNVEGQELVVGETVAEGLSPLRNDLGDEELDQRVRFAGGTLYHPAGTAAMGTVVDTSLKVVGVEGLRIVDASVLPLPIASHYQACIYALAEQAVDVMLG